MVRHGSGYLVGAAPPGVLDVLELPAATGPSNGGRHGSGGTGGYTVSFDARHGVGTGISARDRARTLRVLADPAGRADDLTRPGHVVALSTHEQGVLGRPGVGEAAADLAALAGYGPVGALCALLDPDDGRHLDTTEAAAFAASQGLVIVDLDELVHHRARWDRPLVRGTSATLRTEHGRYTATSYRDPRDQREHLVLATEHALTVPHATMATALSLAVLPECPWSAWGPRTCSCAVDRDTVLRLLDSHGGLVLQPAVRASGPGDEPGSAAGHLAATVTAVLADLVRPLPADPPPVAGVHPPDDDPVHVSLIRPVASCRATGETLTALAEALRRLGLAVDGETLLRGGTSITDDVVPAPAVRAAAGCVA
jgi:3,4-dihydroxy 2-butanone 4-phosphate synthase/GTP cyclohydrolase II